MSKYTKMQTRWEVNETGDLIHVGSGDPAWRTVTENGSEFPMSAKDVASCMNRAFRVGADAKLAEIRNVLGLGPA